MLRILSVNHSHAQENMDRDRELLDQLKDDPILHLYNWKNPSITYGYFVRPEQHLDIPTLEKYGISLARRPTGGGIVFHLWDLAFSFLLPSTHPAFSENSLQNYQFVNEIILQAVQELFSFDQELSMISESYPIMGKGCESFCMARPTQYDVVTQGMKIAGAAQRKTKKGYLHQGTIALMRPKESMLQEILLAKEEVLRAMLYFTFAPLKKEEELHEARKNMQESLMKSFLHAI